MHDDERELPGAGAGGGSAGDDDLTQEERLELAALPRQAQPGDLLAERTVRALRAHGLLEERHTRRAIPLTPFRIAVAAAACLALFAGGFALGRHREPQADLEARAADYLAALDAAARATDPAAGPRTHELGRRTLVAAAESMLRISPDDALAARILQANDTAGTANATSTGAAPQRIVWF